MDSGRPYFDDAADNPAPSQSARVVEVEAALPLVTMAEGLTFRPLVGSNLLVSFVRFQPHTEAPRHAHEEEQAIIVLEGTLFVELPEGVSEVREGQAVHIPAWVPHRAWTDDAPAYEIDVFSPPRQALLAALAASGAQ